MADLSRVPGRGAVLLLSAPLFLYASALNPYFLPAQYDDILYYYGAKSLADTGSYQFNGLYITDWPPVLPALLATLFRAGLESVWTAKLLILFFVGLGLQCTYRLLALEGRPHPLAICLLFTLLPCSFLMGTRIMAEWPYIAVSFLFLILLNLLDERRRSIPFAVLTGSVLGLASLTRWAGVFLGAAVLAQAFARMRVGRGGLRLAFPEVVVAVTGAVIWGLWKAKLTLQLLAGTAEPSENWGSLTSIIHFDPIAQLKLFNDLFFGGLTLFRYLGIADHPAALVLVLPVLATIAGMIAHFRSTRVKPADWYALATLLVLMFYYKIKYTRYLLPIAPLLLSYLFTGTALIARALKVETAGRRLPALVATWMGALVVFNAGVLFCGNAQKTHSGLCVLASPDAASFYAGPWRELYQLCHLMREDPAPGPVAVIGGTAGIGKYILAFSGRPYSDFPPKGQVRFVIARDSAAVPEDTRRSFGLLEVEKSPTFTLYRVAHEQAH